MTSVSSRLCNVGFLAWGLLAIALLFAAYVRIRLRDFPLERDEGEFAYAGQLILDGVPPYQFAYSMKLPGTYIAYAALMAIFGKTTAGIHMGLLTANLATIVLLYRLDRELFDPFSAGMAAVAYAILSASPAVLGAAAHATHFVALFGLAGDFLLWRHLQSGRAWQAFASGLLLGTAFLMKQQGVFLIVFGGGFLLWQGLRLAAYPRKNLPLALSLFSLAALLPYGLVCFWLWRAGTWEKFWSWTVQYASNYVRNIPLSQAGSQLWQGGYGIVHCNWPLLLLALMGIVGVCVLGRGKPGLRSFAFGFLLFSFFCVCPGFYFREHYFIVMLPAVAMLVGVGCRLLWVLAGGRYRMIAVTCEAVPEPAPSSPAFLAQLSMGNRLQKPACSTSLNDNLRGGPAVLPARTLGIRFAGGGCLDPVSTAEFFFLRGPQLACQLTYPSNPFVECPAIAEYLKNNTTVDDKIAVLGSEPEIFFDAQRRSATGYIYTYGLMEDQPLALRMQKEMIAEIEAAKPKYIVFANIGCSWLLTTDSEMEILRWAEKYVDANYDLVGIIEPRSDLDTAYLWDDQVRTYRPPNPPTDRDVSWKLTPYSGEADKQKYWRLPYIRVWRRK